MSYTGLDSGLAIVMENKLPNQDIQTVLHFKLLSEFDILALYFSLIYFIIIYFTNLEQKFRT